MSVLHPMQRVAASSCDLADNLFYIYKLIIWNNCCGAYVHTAHTLTRMHSALEMSIDQAICTQHRLCHRTPSFSTGTFTSCSHVASVEQPKIVIEKLSHWIGDSGSSHTPKSICQHCSPKNTDCVHGPSLSNEITYWFPTNGVLFGWQRCSR